MKEENAQKKTDASEENNPVHLIFDQEQEQEQKISTDEERRTEMAEYEAMLDEYADTKLQKILRSSFGVFFEAGILLQWLDRRKKHDWEREAA